jgi:glycosyltransferase involved in cell wall biosynthesis
MFLLRPWMKRSGIADAVVTMSPRTAQDAVNIGLSAGRLEVIPNPEIDSLPVEEATVQRILGLIVVASPLVEASGIQYLIAAMPHVIQRRPSARLSIAGSGPYEPALQRQVQELGLGHWVRFFGNTPEQWRLLRQAHVFVYPSVDPDKAPPGVILEAFSGATPVVASAIGSISDIVLDRETGLLARPGDAESIARAIIAMLDDPARAQAIGYAGREMVRYSQVSESSVKRFLELLSAVEARQRT